MRQMCPLATCGSKIIIIAEWTLEVANTSFLKWFIRARKPWLVSIRSTLFRLWNGNLGLSLFNFTFGIAEICFFMKSAYQEL